MNHQVVAAENRFRAAVNKLCPKQEIIVPLSDTQSLHTSSEGETLKVSSGQVQFVAEGHSKKLAPGAMQWIPRGVAYIVTALYSDAVLKIIPKFSG